MASLVSWNIDAFSPLPLARSKLLLSHILDAPTTPDVIFLQEVTSGVRDSILNDTRVRDAFLVTDAEDLSSFETVPFTTMTLLSNARFGPHPVSQEGERDRTEACGELIPGRVSRIALPSKYGRDALSVDITTTSAPDTVFRLINVHLDSLEDTFHYRAQQVEILANVLREIGCEGGIIAGDFNAISPEDDALIDNNELVDAWVALHGTADTTTGKATWGVGAKLRNGRTPGRLDKVVMRGVKAERMEVIHPGCMVVPIPGGEASHIPWSDHCGLSCTFTF